MGVLWWKIDRAHKSLLHGDSRCVKTSLPLDICKSTLCQPNHRIRGKRGHGEHCTGVALMYTHETSAIRLALSRLDGLDKCG